MKTPIADFIKKYQSGQYLRFHMPGHKGQGCLGVEKWDITEIPGADALYEAEGIIAESEKQASEIFGSKATFFSTEGSSQCIKAMMQLLLSAYEGETRPWILAARNAHKAFLYAAALLDFDVVWLWEKEYTSLCSCNVTAEELKNQLEQRTEKPAAVYLTTPDYLGRTLPISKMAEICHERNIFLAVDNAHGSYLHFLQEGSHPLDQGADICCDSAHKTLPVLTGGAYLHIGKAAPDSFVENGKQALIPFGSTSPSYLTLMSLDLCNQFLGDSLPHRLMETVCKIEVLKEQLRRQGWQVEATEPLKLTLAMGLKHEESIKADGIVKDGLWLAEVLRKEKIQCEYADRTYVVFMFTANNSTEELKKLEDVLFRIGMKMGLQNRNGSAVRKVFAVKKDREQVMTIRQAVFSRQETIDAEDAAGRVCGIPITGCPPAIPVVVPGERIEKEDIEIFRYYQIKKLRAVICYQQK